jgi:hypothetical protein
MLENLYRDETTVAGVAERFAAFRGFLAAAAGALMAGRRVRGDARGRVHAASATPLRRRGRRSHVRPRRGHGSGRVTIRAQTPFPPPGRGIGAPRFELGTSPTRTVRATRLRHAPERRDYRTGGGPGRPLFCTASRRAQ